MWLLTKEYAVIIANVRAFFERERRAGRVCGLKQVVQRMVDATGASQRTPRRVAADGYAKNVPYEGQPSTRESRRRTPPDELAHLRPAV